jgi:hypothetical protein
MIKANSFLSCFLSTTALGVGLVLSNGMGSNIAQAQTPPPDPDGGTTIEIPTPATPPLPSSPGVLLEVEGVLEPGDQILSADGSLYDELTFEGRAGQPIMVSLESQEFDTYLVVVSPEGRVIAQNDDISPDNTSSSATVILPSDGTYRAIANAFDAEGHGQYTLTITTPDGASERTPNAAPNGEDTPAPEPAPAP